MANVVLCEHQKNDLTVKAGLLCRRSAMHVQRVAVRIFLQRLATVTIVFSRTRRARSETFGISAGNNIHVHSIPL
jgi:hypothetical protein